MKKLWIIILCFLFAGACIMAAGYLAGADLGFYIDDEGVHSRSSDPVQTISKRDVGEITGITVDADSCDLRITESDSYGFDITGESMEYSFEGGELKIQQKDSGFSWHFFNLFEEHNRVSIYLPEDAYIGLLDIRTESGRTNIDKLKAGTILIELTSGKVSIASVSADELTASCTSGDIKVSDSRSGEFDLKLTSGSLVMTGIESGDFSADITSGSAELSGEFLGSNRLKMTSGDLEITLAGREDGYNRSIAVTSGSVYVNGSKSMGTYVNPNAGNSISIEVMSGSVKLDFQSER